MEMPVINLSYMEAFILIVFLFLEFTSWQHGRKQVNVELIREAEYFGDIVMVPYMDNYDLVVLKTIAICEYGVSP